MPDLRADGKSFNSVHILDDIDTHTGANATIDWDTHTHTIALVPEIDSGNEN